MSLQIVVRQAARDDLERIWLYSLRNWGVTQADTYVAELEAGFAKAASRPSAGSDRGYVRPGLRKLSVGSHAVFYFCDDTVLTVSRVLHYGQDADAIFSSD